ncbi:MAG: HAMP domain-containing histidine kinase [Planctomycetes bacterium]|nr:HAMP domain-containing histidine kinase [Planctomycetota bacterium]
MLRPRFIWLVFVVAVGVISAAMGWMTHTTLRLEQAEMRAARQSESERLALWRMDSAVVPLVAQESARPPSEYRSFVEAQHAYSKMFSRIEAGEIQVPSSLLTFRSPYIRLHFQLRPDGQWSCPQVPTGNMRDLAEANYTTHERIEACALQLDDLKAHVQWEELDAAVFRNEALWSPPEDAVTPLPPAPQQPQAGNVIEQQFLQQQAVQSNRSYYEAQRRNQAVAANAAPFQQPAAPPLLDEPGPPPEAVAPHQQPMRATWVGESLLLVRRVGSGKADLVQGCLLHWPAIRERLRDEIHDLLPDARLEPARHEADGAQHLRLASLPVQLVPGLTPMAQAPFFSPLRISLVIAWSGLVLAAAAVAILLLAAVRLSERRGAFVSAVTHELRTPLTTFQLYTEMLAEDMVSSEEKRKSYLNTLRLEAGRLGHLVENVLSFARLDGSRSRARREDVPLTGLLARMEGTLVDRAERAGMTLELTWPDDDRLVASGDAGAIERIVFNLIDNASKYAAPDAADRRIHVEGSRVGERIMLRVRDHGRGVSRGQRRKLFRPFSKSATEAAHSAPGVGLGLALSRRLARSMGGDLWIDRTVGDGACFVLTLSAGQSNR